MAKAPAKTSAPEAAKAVIDLRPPAELMDRLAKFQADKPSGLPAPIMLAGMPVIQIETADQRTICADRHKAAHAMIKLITADYEPIKKSIRGVLDTVQETMKKHLAGPEAVKDIMSRSITMFDAAEAERRRKAQADAERILREQAEKRRQQEVADLEAAAKATKDRDAKAALKEQAEAVKAADVYVPPVPMAKVAEQKGSGTRTSYAAEVVNAEALVFATVASEWIRRLDKGRKDPRNEDLRANIRKFLVGFLDGKPMVESLAVVRPDDSELTRLASAFGKDLNLPGVVVHERKTFTSRA